MFYYECNKLTTKCQMLCLGCLKNWNIPDQSTMQIRKYNTENKGSKAKIKKHLHLIKKNIKNTSYSEINTPYICQYKECLSQNRKCQ